MNKEKSHTFKIRPYARLLTMLGDQLIKNEQIALTELIKNSYDADADWVKVSFENFGTNLEVLNNSKIIIEDNGSGMALDTIKKCWMNPATPNKFSNSDNAPKQTQKKNRIIQGEKGIGRFAILKLGKKILITTRPENSNFEYEINYDLSAYDNNFLTEDKKEKELFLDNIDIKVLPKVPKLISNYKIKVGHETFDRGNSGTRIEISDLKSASWSRKKIETIYQEIIKLESIFDKIRNPIDNNDMFIVAFYLNNERVTLPEDYLDKLSGLMENKAVFKITNGKYNAEERTFSFEENGNPQKLDTEDAVIKKLRVFRDHFCIKKYNEKKEKDEFTDQYRPPECGSFAFNFYIFDFNNGAPNQFIVDRDDKRLIKQHRIYLYRDGIRVFPYGSSDDDWLQVDVMRGTISAGQFFSNDQVVGWLEITKSGNPELKDKTNREGLIEEGNATHDFIALIQSFLSYYRLHQFKKYLTDYQKNKKAQVVFKTEEILRQFDQIKSEFKDDKTVLNAIGGLEKTYSLERQYLIKRVEATEDLASVGLSVETASHDMMMMLSKGILGLDDLIKDTMSESISYEDIMGELQKFRGIFSFVESQMKDLQVMFKSTKQRRRNIRVDDILQKVLRIYGNTLKRSKVEVEIEKSGSPLIANCTDAVLLQLFINLFDNAIYWLTDIDIKERKILITQDENENRLIFSDNGPGIRKDDIPYIFEPFYSGKEEGRGLGLYIARQLLERIGYAIWVADIKSEKVLPGANFAISFIKEEN